MLTTAAHTLYWLPIAAMWIASGSTLLSFALWLIPSVGLSLAWLLTRDPALSWWISGLAIGVIAVSFSAPASQWWSIRVSRIGSFLARISLGPDDRGVDTAAEQVRHRLWVAAGAAAQHGTDRLAADLRGIRRAAEDLPTDDLDHAQLRRALLGLIDTSLAGVEGSDARDALPGTMRAYWDALHRLRCRSTLYRILTIRRGRGLGGTA